MISSADFGVKQPVTNRAMRRQKYRRPDSDRQFRMPKSMIVHLMMTK